jgi:predicted CXXCH cytochrome family protein
VREGAEIAREHLKFEHRSHMADVSGDCVRCHVSVAEKEPTQLRPRMATCFGCHKHQDQWNLRDCDGCHVDLQTEGTLPTCHLVHDGDWIREHGVRAASAMDLCTTCHSERSCAGCHGVASVPALPGAALVVEKLGRGHERVGRVVAVVARRVAGADFYAAPSTGRNGCAHDGRAGGLPEARRLRTLGS